MPCSRPGGEAVKVRLEGFSIVMGGDAVVEFDVVLVHDTVGLDDGREVSGKADEEEGATYAAFRHARFNWDPVGATTVQNHPLSAIGQVGLDPG